MQRGVVTAIDRVNGQVLATLDGGVPIVASYFPRRGRMPWPLARAWFDNSPAWRCLGPIGDRRRILHDDFLTGTGDSPWRQPFAVTASQIAGEGAGVLRITNASGSINTRGLAKDAASVTAPASPAGLWFSARVAIPNITDETPAGDIYNIGFSNVLDGGNQNNVLAEFVPFFGPSWYLTGAANGVSSVTKPLTGVTLVSGTFYIVDLIWVSGHLAALWVNGSGPISNTSNVPTGGTEPAMTVAAASRSFDIDWVHVEQVSPVVDPSTLTKSVAA